MSCSTLTPAVQRSLGAQPTVAQFAWLSDWMPCTGLKSVLAVLKNKAVSGSFRAQVVLQWAPVRTDNPSGALTSVGNALSDGGEVCVVSGDLSTTSAANYYVRFGVKYDVHTGSNGATADVELQVSYDVCGQIAGVWSGQLAATSSTNLIQAVGPWVPVLSASKLKFIAAVTSLTGDFRWRPTYRTAATAKEAAGAWVTDWDIFRTSGEVNTGELTPSTSGTMWIQPGILYNLSGAAVGQASVAVSVAVRK